MRGVPGGEYGGPRTRAGGPRLGVGVPGRDLPVWPQSRLPAEERCLVVVVAHASPLTQPLARQGGWAVVVCPPAQPSRVGPVGLRCGARGCAWVPRARGLDQSSPGW